MLIMQSNLLLNRINDQQDIRMIEAGRFKPKKEKFNLRSVLQFVKVLFQPQITLFNIQLTVKVDESVPEHLCGD